MAMRWATLVPAAVYALVTIQILDLLLLLSPSSLCLLHDRPMNPRGGVEAKRDFNWGASRPRRWQASVSKSPSYWGPDARFFYRSERKKQ